MAFSGKKQKLFQLSSNLVDQAWKDRPAAEALAVVVQPPEFAGCSVQEKLKDLREKLLKENAHGIIFCSLDEVWLHTYISSFKMSFRSKP
jgi:Xaa-Pro aminopeptidase